MQRSQAQLLRRLNVVQLIVHEQDIVGTDLPTNKFCKGIWIRLDETRGVGNQKSLKRAGQIKNVELGN